MTILSACTTSALALALLVSCAADTDHGPKPTQDPDVELQDDKADGVSNRFTTIVGEIVPTQKVSSEIDWPDWFHGYTVELEAGSTMEIEVDASAEGPFRVYGPSHRTRWDGRPMFRRAMKRGWADLYAGRYTTRFDVEVEETGTYLVVYGPAYEWSADYTIGVRCAAGCRLPDQCFDDIECEDGDFCGDNGVRCITQPCDANYDVCQAAQELGSWCDRDSMCDDSFCGWGDDNVTRECKAFSQAGERCRGFVVPSARSFCAPGLTCVFPEPTNDVPGICE